MKGEFENRLKRSYQKKRSHRPCQSSYLLSEAHTMIGAGGPAGQAGATQPTSSNRRLLAGQRENFAPSQPRRWSEYKEVFRERMLHSRADSKWSRWKSLQRTPSAM